MASRLSDTSIWDQDWFIELTPDHKLLYLYIKDKCDASGIWRPNKSHFKSLVLNGRGSMIFFDEFLTAVNSDYDSSGKKVFYNRIKQLENGRWFVTANIKEQYGTVFNPLIGAHRGLLKNLVNNGIHPKEIESFDWKGFQKLNFQALREIVHLRGMYTLDILDIYHKHTLIEIEREIIIESNKERGYGGEGISTFPEPVINPEPLATTTVPDLVVQPVSTTGQLPSVMTREFLIKNWPAIVDDFLNNEKHWIEQMMMANRDKLTSIEMFNQYANKFLEYIWDGNDQKVPQQLRKHFSHWIKKVDASVLEKDKKQSTKKVDKSTTGVPQTSKNYQKQKRW